MTSFFHLDRWLRGAARRLLALPPRGLRRLAGAPIQNPRGDVLDPAVQLMIRLQETFAPSKPPLDVTRARADMARSATLAMSPPRPLQEVRELTLPGPQRDIPARLYHPAGQGLPLVVYLHGGGWVVGDLDSHDSFCRRLAHEAQVVVLAVDYALAPEHPFPAAPQECLAALRYAQEHASAWGADPAQVGLGGDSAGGNLTLAVGQLAGDQPAVFQLLIYPATDQRRLTPSHQAFGHGFLLDQEALTAYLDHYGAPREAPLASPALAPVDAHAPPTILVTAGFDPLRDEGEAYAKSLRAAGVEVTELRYPGLVHGFINFDGLVPTAYTAVSEITQAVRHRSRGAETASSPEEIC